MATTVSTQALSPVLRLQNEKISAEKHRPDHLFIHTVRFWSMAAIVFLHSAFRFGHYQPVVFKETALLAQPFKFGTIAFFIISGFLVGDRLPSSDPLGYLRRRAHRLVPAWMLWYGIDLLLTCQRDLLHAGRGALSPHLVFSALRTNSFLVLTATPLWFVPNFLVALTCVVLLRGWLNDLRLGAALLAVNLFYGVNVYTQWLPSLHTEAVFGFVFYLWLGAWSALRKDRVLHFAQSISGWWLVFWACVAFGISLIETEILRSLHSPDDMNSLRFGNQIYAILIVLLLVRIRRRTWPGFVKVAETTYGIYLIHAFVIELVFALAAPVVYAHGQAYGAVGIFVMWLVLAPAAYFLSLQFTRAVASSTRWSWAVGATPLQRPSR